MTHYLALIRKADFTDLFKYGKLHVNNDMKTNFACPVEELPSHPEIFFNLTYYANSFDSAFAYLIIHYIKVSTEGLANDVNIEEVQNIYPLDYESKDAFSMSFDERIRIEDPIWPESVWNLQKQQQFNDCEKGAANIRKILGFSDKTSECKKFITNDIVREVVNELYDEKRPKGNLSIWVYLLRYERHSYYPQNTLGYFMDMVNVVCNCLGQAEVEEDNIKNTQVFRYLDSLRNNPKLQFPQIYQQLIDSPETQGFLKKIDEFEPRVDFAKVAILFLVLRNRYKEDFVYEEEFISYCKQFDFEFELAAYLLGIVMGHMHTYDCMYDRLPLSIFKIATRSHITNENGCGAVLIGESPEEGTRPGTTSTDTVLDEQSDATNQEYQEDAYIEESDGNSEQKDVDDLSISNQSEEESVVKTVSESGTESTGNFILAFSHDEEETTTESQIETVAEIPLGLIHESSDEGTTSAEESTTEVSLTTTGNKDIFGEDEIKFPFKMKKPSGGRARSIKDASDYAKKYHKNLIDGYTEIIYD